jgi:hypothetical protein
MYGDAISMPRLQLQRKRADSRPFAQRKNRTDTLQPLQKAFSAEPGKALSAGVPGRLPGFVAGLFGLFRD